MYEVPNVKGLADLTFFIFFKMDGICPHKYLIFKKDIDIKS